MKEVKPEVKQGGKHRERDIPTFLLIAEFSDRLRKSRKSWKSLRELIYIYMM